VDFTEVVRKRRSIRKYRPDPVPEELLNTVLEAARQAPSWANTQCWKFVVVTDPETRRALAQAGNKWVADAPAIIVQCADPSLPGVKGDQHYYMFDAGLAMENLMLAAADQGLGTCCLGAFDEEAVRRAIKAPANIRIVAETPIGYPAEEPPAKPRKPLADIACPERYR
jgi:nitroreductase